MASSKQAMDVNPDLAAERLTATFNVAELTTLIDQSEENTKERRFVEKFFYEDSNMPDVFGMLNLSTEDMYKSALETAKYFDKKISETDNLPGQGFGNMQAVGAIHSRCIAYPMEHPFGLHSVLFRPTILRLGTNEQIEKLIPLIDSQKIIGTYAQTELGHGSNIRRLETTATYDPTTEEFVLHSPTLTSSKCWPGGLGRTCNYAIIMAQLHIKNRCYGLHMFVVQFRDLKNHTPLPGITVGEIGPKLGMQNTDNGFLRFKHFRIPRENMLMKHSKVLRDGTYIKPQNEHSNYGMMVFVRVSIVMTASLSLGRVCTIAVRYNAVRRQGSIEEGGPEIKIIDYQTQQYKLFPQVALAYALYFTFRRMLVFYIESLSNESPEFLNESHALAAGMKALSASLCATGAEICRQACGGLGYLRASHLPEICSQIQATCTYEGDNTILYLQTARYLIKSIKNIQDKKPVGKTVDYLKTNRFVTPDQRTCMTEFVNLYEVTSARKIRYVAKKILSETAKGKKLEVVWQSHLVDLVKCAEIHMQLQVLRSLHDFFCATQLSNSLHAVLDKLFRLLAVYWVQKDSGDLVLFGGFTRREIRGIYLRIPNLLKELRPNIVSLVDAFDFCDAALHSVIGSYDGRVYERLHDYWSKLPANKNETSSFDVSHDETKSRL